MAQKLFTDKITQLSHSAGNILLASGAILTIGGQQYVTTTTLVVALPALTANTRYQVYAVISAGSPVLVISQNENSVGPVGYNRWKLVGSLYANGLGSVGFGSFANIEGSPTTGAIAHLPTTNVTTNTTPTGLWMRDKSVIKVKTQLAWTGAPSAFSTMDIDLPANLLVEINSMLSSVANKDNIGEGVLFDPAGGTTRYGVKALYLDTNSVRLKYSASTGTFTHYADISNISPYSIASGSYMNIEFELPVVGWSNTPIKDL